MVNRAASVAEASRKSQCYLTATPAVEATDEGHATTCRDRSSIRCEKPANRNDRGRAGAADWRTGGGRAREHSARHAGVHPIYVARESFCEMERCGISPAGFAPNYCRPHPNGQKHPPNVVMHLKQSETNAPKHGPSAPGARIRRAFKVHPSEIQSKPRRQAHSGNSLNRMRSRRR